MASCSCVFSVASQKVTGHIQYLRFLFRASVKAGEAMFLTTSTLITTPITTATATTFRRSASRVGHSPSPHHPPPRLPPQAGPGGAGVCLINSTVVCVHVLLFLFQLLLMRPVEETDRFGDEQPES